MSTRKSISRRRFVAGASGLALAGVAGRATARTTPSDTARLAIDGGEKAVTTKCEPKPRWGDLERKQLDAMLQQNSLFYWKGPQSELLLKRFREVCPVEYAHNCSSGTAAIGAISFCFPMSLECEITSSRISRIFLRSS